MVNRPMEQKDLVNFLIKMSNPAVALEKYLWDTFIKNLFESKDRIGISIIGPTDCGKTTLFDIIRQEDNATKEGGRGTSDQGRTLLRKTIQVGNKSIEIKETKDYDGSITSTNNYKSLFRGVDIIIFIFDMEQFISNPRAEEMSYRAQFASMLKMACLDGEKYVKDKRIFVIGSRKDKLRARKYTERTFKDMYYRYLTEQGLEQVRLFPFMALNLLDKQSVREFLEQEIYQYAK